MSLQRATASKWRATCLVLAATATLLASGCQQKMAEQPSYKPHTHNDFFADQRTARNLIPEAIPRGHLRIDEELFTGRREAAATLDETTSARPPAEDGGIRPYTTPGADDGFITYFPFPITQEVLDHGRNRYTIYCVMCHDPLGTGQGKIVERGFTAPPSYHTELLRTMPPGRMYAVISEGFGSMPSYAEQIRPRDRWAIVAYIRALQLSQKFPVDELRPEMREELEKAAGGRDAAAAEKSAGAGKAAGARADFKTQEGVVVR